ncbi:chondroitin sulfate proteoglycan 5 isoform X1 [Polypterus senegalus]|uniref:chondroitin sulfate proteoglycan 5 isoform X1 n=1 Tax=Polypterus senegalus TaxID=55291 RepID=UPI001966417C|nr:chondroitin sulfate proteoglycan 5 isoform X1 [Polypterus senegalus]
MLIYHVGIQRLEDLPWRSQRKHLVRSFLFLGEELLHLLRMGRTERCLCPGCWRLPPLLLLLCFFALSFAPLGAEGASVESNVTLPDYKNNTTLDCLGCRLQHQGAEAIDMKTSPPMTGKAQLISGESIVQGLPNESQEELGSGDQLLKHSESTFHRAAGGVGVLAESSTIAPLLLDMTTVGMPSSTEISLDSAEKDHLLEVSVDSSSISPMTKHVDATEIQLDFKQVEHVLWEGRTDSPTQAALGGLEVTQLDVSKQMEGQSGSSPTTESTTVQDQTLSDTLEGEYYDPFVLGETTSLPLSDLYDYLTPYDDSYTTTEVYPDEGESTTSDLEDENNSRITTVFPGLQILLQNTGTLKPLLKTDPRFTITESVSQSGFDEEGGPLDVQMASGQGADRNNSTECGMGYTRHNSSCKSLCDIFPSYCFNGGQCYQVEGTGAVCRCNTQDYIWHKGARCESVITEFQVMCVAIGAAALMVLLLFMVTVFFAKKLHLLKTENSKLRKRSKYRPPSEQHNDNFSLSTIAEGSHPNVRKLCDTPPNLPHARALAYYDNIICQRTISRYTWECESKEETRSQDDPNAQNKLEDPVKASLKENESLNIQNSLTPKHENNKAASEENSEVNSLQNNMM